MKFPLLTLSAAVAALAFTLSSAAQEPAQGGKAKNKVYNIASQDAEMEEAIAQARATFDGFLKTHAKPPKGAEDFKIKVKFSEAGNNEHIWVTPFVVTPKGFQGTLAGEPRYISYLDNGQDVSFTRADVSDWGYTLNGKQKGSYTVCVMFKHMPAADANRYRRDYGFEC